MIIKDKIYGWVEINDPILVELLKSPSLLRLKKMSNYGIPDKYYHHKGFSRYEHSAGVMILLRKFGAGLEEQIAGLLHDVSHLTFSHVADWIFADGGVKPDNNEEFADRILEKFIKKTDIAKILEKFNFSIKKILRKDSLPLLERKIPDLCVDRVDYALRELRYVWKVDLGILKNYLKNLVNLNGEIIFTEPKIAFDFAERFLKMQTKHWGGYEAMVRYYLFSQILKQALRRKIILKKDFFKDEKFILKKLGNSDEKGIKEILSLLRKKKIGKVRKSSHKKIFKKFRYVDPKIIVNGNLVRLSKINPRFKKMIDKHKEINKRGFII